ncbi:HugZ family protein [Rhizobium halophytocola]|uniref:Heme iron utilization protein n=1 Tax=Rhizobium halophytocola TaxID=735519 RepID=A0ABS4E5X7_9HYPH|nr:pyridoxamine 5'-phosphate oxidase family protein [Rhizobium halophytocola]MBP1853353.1 putative heme iron utilization protein [Rhizobium halophytocola]
MSNDTSGPGETAGPPPGNQDQPPPRGIRPTDDEARLLGRRLLAEARFAALAFRDPETGHPSVSRVLVSIDEDGMPVTLLSQLAGHTRALIADQNCAVLIGEPGKGDPLAHPRMSLQCVAEKIARDDDEHERLRPFFLTRHPKAALYADFADFAFWRLRITGANLNGGFGRAYILQCTDLKIPPK